MSHFLQRFQFHRVKRTPQGSSPVSDRVFAAATKTIITSPSLAAVDTKTSSLALPVITRGSVYSPGAAYTGTDTAPAATTPGSAFLTTFPAASYSATFASVAPTSYSPSLSAPTHSSTAVASTGAKPVLTKTQLYAIIGGSGGAGVIIIAIIAWFCWRKARTKKKERAFWQLNESTDPKDRKSVIQRDPGYSASEAAGVFSREKNWGARVDDDRDRAMPSPALQSRYNAPSVIASKPSTPEPFGQNRYGHREQQNADAAASRAELFGLVPPPACNNSRTVSEIGSDNGIITFDGSSRMGSNGPRPNFAAYPPSPSSPNRPFSKALPPTRPHYRPSEVPNGAQRLHSTPSGRRPAPPPLPSAAIALPRNVPPSPERSDSGDVDFMNRMMNEDSESHAVGMALGEGDNNSRKRQSMGRQRSHLSMEEPMPDFSGAQSAWADLRPNPRNAAAYPVEDPAPVVRASSKRVRPPLPSSINLPAANEVIVPNRSVMQMEIVTPSHKNFEEHLYDDERREHEDRYGRVDSRPLHDLEDLLDSFSGPPAVYANSSRSLSNASKASGKQSSVSGLRIRNGADGQTPPNSSLYPTTQYGGVGGHSTSGLMHSPSAHSSRGDIGSAPLSPSRQQQRAPHLPSAGLYRDERDNEMQHVVRKVSVRRLPGNPVRVGRQESVREHQRKEQRQHYDDYDGRSLRSSEGEPSFDHSLRSVASSSPVTPRDHQATPVFPKSQAPSYVQQDHRIDANGFLPLGATPDQRRSINGQERSVTDDIWDSYDYGEDGEAGLL